MKLSSASRHKQSHMDENSRSPHSDNGSARSTPSQKVSPATVVGKCLTLLSQGSEKSGSAPITAAMNASSGGGGGGGGKFNAQIELTQQQQQQQRCSSLSETSSYVLTSSFRRLCFLNVNDQCVCVFSSCDVWSVWRLHAREPGCLRCRPQSSVRAQRRIWQWSWWSRCESSGQLLFTLIACASWLERALLGDAHASTASQPSADHHLEQCSHER